MDADPQTTGAARQLGPVAEPACVGVGPAGGWSASRVCIKGLHGVECVRHRPRPLLGARMAQGQNQNGTPCLPSEDDAGVPGAGSSVLSGRPALLASDDQSR